MKKASSKPADGLRPYKRSDFASFVRGKYAQIVANATNVVVLDPQIVRTVKRIP